MTNYKKPTFRKLESAAIAVAAGCGCGCAFSVGGGYGSC
ncbi:hypothetical protein HNR77_003311 [Paenibacillus sp. JGP012]|nr:hypothetical protein [Paenibacillus sp. JGP012]